MTKYSAFDGTEESVRMEVFLGYFCERIFIFFRKHESPTKVKGTVHVSHDVFKMSNNLGSTKNIKMIETLKHSVFQAQFVVHLGSLLAKLDQKEPLAVYQKEEDRTHYTEYLKLLRNLFVETGVTISSKTRP